MKYFLQSFLVVSFFVGIYHEAVAKETFSEVVSSMFEEETQTTRSDDGMASFHKLNNSDQVVVLGSMDKESSIVFWCEGPKKNLRVALTTNQDKVDMQNVRAIDFVADNDKYSSLLQTKLPFNSNSAFFMLVSDNTRSVQQKSMKALIFISDNAEFSVGLVPSSVPDYTINFSYPEIKYLVDEFMADCEKK